MQNEIKTFIEQKLNKSIVLEKPKDISLGHFSTPIAFSLAKELRKNPIQIAIDLALEFEHCDMFEDVQAVKGFLNFKLSNEYLLEQINKALKENDNFAKANNKEKILLEYVSANPTGPLHIGHARGAVFGDALYRVGKHLGYDINTEYYVNDAGSQMGLLSTSLYLAAKEHILKQEVTYPETYYRGQYLIDIAKKCIQSYGNDVFSSEDKKDELAIFAKDEVLKIIVSDLHDLGINFQSFVSEKSLYPSWDGTKKYG